MNRVEFQLLIAIEIYSILIYGRIFFVSSSLSILDKFDFDVAIYYCSVLR